MTSEEEERRRRARRAFLSGAARVAAVAATGSAVARTPDVPSASSTRSDLEPFWGQHQGGIATAPQKHVYFVALDLRSGKREDVVALLRAWTSAAARMTSGETAQPVQEPLRVVGTADGAATSGSGGYAAPTAGQAGVETSAAGRLARPPVPAGDSGEALDLAPARLTLTFGFGAGLFEKDGQDRYRLAAQRPEAFIDLPKFPGDQLLDDRTGGDLSIQACADDPQVAFHAARQLARMAGETAQIRWVQAGFTPTECAQSTPRNLMGFKDGTNNPSIVDPKALDRIVWVGEEGPAWMRGGSYLVARRIRIALEHWDRMQVSFQEQTVGRHKYSGAPLGQKNEFEPLKLDAMDADGNPLIPENSHVRLAAAASNEGAQILRRPFSYNDGVNFTAERWPPWRQAMEYDAGLFFLAYQRDIRSGFVKIYERMARFDMLNQFVTHVGGGLFACAGGARPGEYIAQRLFEA